MPRKYVKIDEHGKEILDQSEKSRTSSGCSKSVEWAPVASTTAVKRPA